MDKDYLTFDELQFKLRRWWCHYYKRPYKDPLLDSYTLEELLYEYFDLTLERDKANGDQAPTEVPKEEYDWAAEEEAREAKEAAEQLSHAELDAESEDDTIVEEAEGLSDEAWAEKHEATEKVLKNPSADQVDSDDGDIEASFEV